MKRKLIVLIIILANSVFLTCSQNPKSSEKILVKYIIDHNAPVDVGLMFLWYDGKEIIAETHHGEWQYVRNAFLVSGDTAFVRAEWIGNVNHDLVVSMRDSANKLITPGVVSQHGEPVYLKRVIW